MKPYTNSKQGHNPQSPWCQSSQPNLQLPNVDFKDDPWSQGPDTQGHHLHQQHVTGLAGLPGDENTLERPLNVINKSAVCRVIPLQAFNIFWWHNNFYAIVKGSFWHWHSRKINELIKYKAASFTYTNAEYGCHIRHVCIAFSFY